MDAGRDVQVLRGEPEADRARCPHSSVQEHRRRVMFRRCRLHYLHTAGVKVCPAPTLHNMIIGLRPQLRTNKQQTPAQFDNGILCKVGCMARIGRDVRALGSGPGAATGVRISLSTSRARPGGNASVYVRYRCYATPARCTNVTRHILKPTTCLRSRHFNHLLAAGN